jgi:aconitate decarboxylase
MEGLTDALCERIAALRYEDLGPDTVARVKDAIGDGLSVAVDGSTEKPVAILADYVRSLESAPRSTVWGYGFKSSAASAALVNAASAHVLDYEPMSSPSTHAVSPVMPVAFALAEVRDCSGRDIVTACAKGFEMQHRLLYAGKLPPRSDRRFHQVGMVGGMGAAVAAAHLLGLDANGLRAALGIAASRAGSLLANGGTMTKCAHAGYAASGGLEAALLAERGFSGNARIMEHGQGYAAAFLDGDSLDRARLLDFGKPFRVVDPGMAYKFFPSKYPTQFAITGALQLYEKIKDPSRIARIRMITPLMPDVDRPQPATGLEGKFSFQYCVAAALLDGEVGKHSFSDERRFAADLVAVLPKFEIAQTSEIPLEFTQMRIELEVEMQDGTRHRTVCSKPKGFWGVAIEPAEHLKKMRDCMSGRFGDAEIKQCYETVSRLEQIDVAAVRKLVQLLGKTSSG